MTATMAGERYVENKLKHDVRVSNMTAAKKLADAIRTSLGPERHGQDDGEREERRDDIERWSDDIENDGRDASGGEDAGRAVEIARHRGGGRDDERGGFVRGAVG